jgi:hypothetical protein
MASGSSLSDGHHKEAIAVVLKILAMTEQEARKLLKKKKWGKTWEDLLRS